MSLIDDAKQALEDAGTQLKADLWMPDDKAFLEDRAKDLVELAAKAAKARDPAQKAGYLAAARDTMISVKVLAMIRMEATEQHIVDALEKLFWNTVVPRLIKALPALQGFVP
jgi:alkylhydroperoxidase/carboxymuconolactone decarboxylase family protein YurZ